MNKLSRKERRLQRNFQHQYNGRVLSYEEAVKVGLVKERKINKYSN